MAKSKMKLKKSGGSASKTRVDAASIVEDEYGNYRIKAGRLSGNFVARAFPKSVNDNKGLMAEASGASESEAIAALKSLLDERGAQRVAARRWEERSEVSVPSFEEFVEALQQANLSEAQLSMLKTQAIAGKDGLTMSRLMTAAGYRSEATAIKVYERAGAVISDFLGVEPTKREADDKAAARVFSYLEDPGNDAPVRWVMHDEMCQAVRATM